jgi:hypothetical protein
VFCFGVVAELRRQVEEAAKEDGQLPDLTAVLQGRVEAAVQAKVVNVKDHQFFKQYMTSIGAGTGDDDDDELAVVHTQVRGWVGG